MKNKKLISCICLAIVLIALTSFASISGGNKNNGVDPAELGIRYVSFGSGEKTMIVVPGLSIGYVTDNGAALEGSFKQFAEDYTVYLFDIRENVPGDYTITQMGEDLASAIKGLGLTDLYMYGCSMGGMQCIYVAGAHPELVEKIAVASSACEANETSDAVIGNWIKLAKEGSYRELTADMGQKIYSKAMYEANKEGFAATADGLTDEIAARFINTANVIPGFDLTKEATAIKCPVLVLGAEGDQVLTADASREIAEITGGEIILYGEEYPHAVYDEAPGFKDDVAAFFAK